MRTQKRTITITFQASDKELDTTRTQLDALVDRLILGDLDFLSGRTVNLIRMLRGQVAVASGYIRQADYEETVRECRLDSAEIDI